MIGNREIKRPRICHDFKTANFNSRKFKWGYSMYKYLTMVFCFFHAYIFDTIYGRYTGTYFPYEWNIPASIIFSFVDNLALPNLILMG